ncbi:MAG: EthD domain-containing protein [Nocardioidaceae bacterium]
MIKTILGYDIVEGVSAEEYERWLFEVHAPDLLANPHLDRIVFNKVLRPVRQASGGTAEIPEGHSFYRIAEMHFADEEAYERYQEWFDDHPLPAERGPGGRTDFKFYLLAEPTEVTRESLAAAPRPQ